MIIGKGSLGNILFGGIGHINTEYHSGGYFCWDVGGINISRWIKVVIEKPYKIVVSYHNLYFTPIECLRMDFTHCTWKNTWKRNNIWQTHGVNMGGGMSWVCYGFTIVLNLCLILMKYKFELGREEGLINSVGK